MDSSAFPISDLRSETSLMSAERVQQAVIESKKIRGFPLSDASLRYVAALYDPRQCYEAPWIPSQTCFSDKFHVFVRGSFATGTTGYGYVTARLNSASDTYTTISTTSASVGGAATLFNAYSNLTNSTNNSKYVAANFGTTGQLLSGRPVAAALYVRYAGTEMNRGGDYLLIEEPNHSDLQANYSYNLSLTQDGCKRIPVTQEWVHVCFTPNSQNEFAFNSANLPNAPVGGNNVIGIAVSSAVAAQPFEFEFHMWAEAAGASARSATASYNDVLGSDVILGAGNMYQQLDCVLGLDGFMRAIHAQMSNQSGVLSGSAPSGNWAGLLPYLPLLASLAGPVVKTIGSAFSSYGKGKGKKSFAEQLEKKTEKRLEKGLKSSFKSKK